MSGDRKELSFLLSRFGDKFGGFVYEVLMKRTGFYGGTKPICRAVSVRACGFRVEFQLVSREGREVNGSKCEPMTLKLCKGQRAVLDSVPGHLMENDLMALSQLLYLDFEVSSAVVPTLFARSQSRTCH